MKQTSNYEGEKMMKKKKILLWYDVEDYVTEEAENAQIGRAHV